MNASSQSLIELIQPSSLRFVVPVYQRPYSWDREHCEQLWEDIMAVGKRTDARHFTGSVVWIQDGVMAASGVTPRLLIDGQQRVTTVTLLLVALAEYARAHADRDLALLWKAERMIGAKIYCRDKTVYAKILVRRQEVDARLAKLNGEISWDDLEADKKSRSLTVRRGADWENADLSSLYEWLVKAMFELRKIAMEVE